MAPAGTGKKTASELVSPPSFRQVQVIFNPWASGHTTVSVVTADYRGDRRVLHRLGSLDLPVGRLDLVGLSPLDLTEFLLDHLQKWMSDNRRTIPRPSAPAPPLGATGGACEQVPGQQSLDLDLRD